MFGIRNKSPVAEIRFDVLTSSPTAEIGLLF